MQPQQKTLAWVLLISLSLIWGTSFFMIKKALLVFSPYQLASFRVVLASVILLPLSIYYLKSVNKKEYLHLFIAGFLGIFLSSILFPIAQNNGVSSAITSILNATYPIFIVVIGLLFFNEKINRFQLFGLLIGFLGVSFLIFFNGKGELKWNSFALFALAAVLCNATYAYWIKYHLKNVSPLANTSIAMLFIFPLGIVGSFVTDVPQTIQTHPEAMQGILYITYLSLLATALGTLLYNYLLQISSPIFASLVTYLIPIVSLFWGLYDGESISFWQSLGMIAVIGGVYLLNKKNKKI